MIRQIDFRNFKALRDTTLKLGPFTLIVGPNGSGKSTVLQALNAIRYQASLPYERILSIGAKGAPQVVVHWDAPLGGVQTVLTWSQIGALEIEHKYADLPIELRRLLDELPSRIRTFSFEGPALATPVALTPHVELGPKGENLAGVLDRLRDQAPERFEQLNKELSSWLPEFDRVLFETSGPGQRELKLRVGISGHSIRASELSHGTLFALAVLTLAYEPEPPRIVGIEEPDRGIHPRLLRRIQDALYRISHPEQVGDRRQPAKVIVTTHSPFFLDLYRDHADEIVIAQKSDGTASLTRLSERSDVAQLLGDAPLGDLWYSGILGGVPQEQ